MIFTPAIAALAALLPSLALAKDGRTFAVMHFYGKDPLTVGRMDPIINPGTTSGHVHTIMGGNAFSMSMPGTTATDATCTNARLKNDKSNYWTPSLYFQHDNGSFTAVEMFYMNVYYFFEGTDDEIKAFPPGFRMVSGNPMIRAPPNTGGKINLNPADGEVNPVGWTCPRSNTNSPLYPVNSNGLNGVGIQDPNNKGAGVGFPDQNCDGYASPLRADVHFPSCYNPAAGVENYKTNTAFPSSAGASGAGKANCPAGWIHTPHIFYEVYWNTPKFASLWTPGQGKQPFVLANGDPTGYGLHGDFINGWDTNTLQTIIDTCDAGDSGMDKCPQIIGGLSDTSGADCNVPSAVKEVVDGTMAKLPGCNPVQKGPGLATMQTCSGNAVPVVAQPNKVSTSSKVATTAMAGSTAKAAPTKVATTFSTVKSAATGKTTSAVKPATTATATNKHVHSIKKTRTHNHRRHRATHAARHRRFLGVDVSI